ncbi:MAG: hypothetical protein KC516_02390 [Nanoarchaeota archaeon]|nr:hypothetical protein [Nanoarchaeota archaeon]
MGKDINNFRIDNFKELGICLEPFQNYTFDIKYNENMYNLTSARKKGLSHQNLVNFIKKYFSPKTIPNKEIYFSREQSEDSLKLKFKINAWRFGDSKNPIATRRLEARVNIQNEEKFIDLIFARRDFGAVHI